MLLLVITLVLIELLLLLLLVMVVVMVPSEKAIQRWWSLQEGRWAVGCIPARCRRRVGTSRRGRRAAAAAALRGAHGRMPGPD